MELFKLVSIDIYGFKYFLKRNALQKTYVETGCEICLLVTDKEVKIQFLDPSNNKIICFG